MAVYIMYALVVILTALFICHPIGYQWNLQPSEGYCGDANAAYAVGAALDMATDLAIMLLPMPMVWRLQILVRHRLGLVLVFGLGILYVALNSLSRRCRY